MNSQQPPRASRRRFLEVGGAALFGAAALPLIGGTDQGDNKKQEKGGERSGDGFGGFRVGAQSYTFRQFNLEQTLQRIHDLGLHYVEFYNGHVPLNSTPEQIQAVLRRCRELEITPIGFGVERFTRNTDANRRIFELGRALGVRYLSADPDPDSFDSLDTLVREFNINIAIHPHGPEGPANNRRLHRWYSAEVIMRAVRDHDRRIGSCLDTGHLIRAAQLDRRLDPAAEVRTMGNRNFAMHLKDHDNRNHTDVVFGRGVLDVPAVLRALRAVNFDGALSIEYEANPNNPMADVRACIEVFRTAARNLG
jgi:sugar phosphate isomerase/epimerase